MSILSLRDIQGIATYNNKVRIPLGHQLSFDGNLKVPIWTTSTRPQSPDIGLIGYNTTDKVLEIYNGTEWGSVSGSGLDGSSESKAAPSASTLRTTLGASATNGSYWYKFSDGTTRRLYTDFTTFSNYSFVMSTRLSSADHLQYLTTERNPEDLALVPANLSAPSRSSKLSDAQLNEIITTNTIRYAIVGPFSVFYRMNDSWTSNFGAAASCSYTTPHYNSYATPSNTPSWQTSWAAYQGACGGGYDNASNWLILTGIHTNDANYTGGYTGASSFRGTPPAQYTASNAGNGSWGVPGYVFLSW